MKIIAIMGSPHINGNGNEALNSLLSGAMDSGALVKRYDLVKLNINQCLGCRACVFNGGSCVCKDDFIEIFKKIKECNLLIIESPIYINQVNGITKTFLDRLYPLTDEKHKRRYEKREVMMLMTYGAPIPLIFTKYINSTGRSLKAMGLINKKNIIIPGCTTLDKVKKDIKLQNKLYKMGLKIGKR